MITLRKLAYQYLDKISGGGMTVDSRIDERDVIIRIRQLMADVVALKYFEKYEMGDRSAVSVYIGTYKLTPQYDSEMKECFVTLPDFYLSLPYNRGIHRAFFIDKKKDFVIQHTPSVSSNLPAGRVPDIVYAYLEGYRMVIRNVSVEPNTTLPKVVLQLIVPGADAIGEDDNLPIVPEQISEILRRLEQNFMPIPQDTLNNGNKDI